MQHLAWGSNILEPSSNCPVLCKTFELNMFFFFKSHALTKKPYEISMICFSIQSKASRTRGEMNYDFFHQNSSKIVLCKPKAITHAILLFKLLFVGFGHIYNEVYRPTPLSLNSSWYKGPDIWSWRRKVVDDMLDLNFLHLGSVSHTLGYLLRPQPLAYVLVVFILKFFIALEWTKTFTVEIQKLQD